MKDKCVDPKTCVKDQNTCAESAGDACDATADDKGCKDGFSCATAPDDLKNKCVASDACDKDQDGVKTTCGASALAATVVAAFAIASTM